MANTANKAPLGYKLDETLSWDCTRQDLELAEAHRVELKPYMNLFHV